MLILEAAAVRWRHCMDAIEWKNKTVIYSLDKQFFEEIAIPVLYIAGNIDSVRRCFAKLSVELS